MHTNPWNIWALLENPQLIIFTLGGLVFAVRWLYANRRSANVERVFIHSMATNHLPHIYHALNKIATSLGIVMDEPPQIKFISEDDFKRHNIEGK